MSHDQTVSVDEERPERPEKKPYTAPRLTVHGSVEEITQQPDEDEALSHPRSDRHLKERFAPVDPHDVLARVTALPVETWNYKDQDPAIRHIGPMAQDFAAAFGVGEDDRHINLLDANGVALAAIQGLYRIVQTQEAQLRALRAEVRALRSETRVSSTVAA